MEEKISRKGFIATLAAAFAVLAGGAVLFLKTKSGKETNSMTTNPSSGVLEIRPLGFQWETADPFLFCVHHEDFYPQGNSDFGPAAALTGRNIGEDFTPKDGWRMYHGEKVPGFPNHPHRGFETVTVVRQGFVDHSDSMGAAGRYGAGDVQWMTAGAGVQHAEMFPLLESGKANTLELFQIWLNLPRANKFVKPHFKMLWSKDIPKVSVKDAAGIETRIEVIAGAVEKTKAEAPPPDSWAAKSENSVAIWHIDIDPHGEWTLPAAAGTANRFLYFYRGGKITLADTEITAKNGARLDSAQAMRIKNGDQPASLLLLQGKPIAEPVVQYGPFVMNTRGEIEQAFADYQRTHFGGWPWKTPEPVHDKNKGRFARHADGKEEIAAG